MTRLMDSVQGNVNTVKNWLEDNTENAQEWKLKLISSKLVEILFVIDQADRRAAERRG